MKIIGLQDTLRKFDQIEKEIDSSVIKEVASATVAVESGAVARTPVGNYVGGGNLKSSNGYRFDGDYVGEVFNSAEYAQHVEFGTYKMAAQPYLLPSFENIRPQFISNLESILKDVR